MNERIKKVRLEHGLSQEEFGKKIGIRRSSVSLLESGKNTPADRTVKLICQEFNVNEQWLRTGEGVPDAVDSQDLRFAKNIAKLQRTDNETIINWVNAIAETNPEMLVEIEKFFKSLLGIK